MFISLSEYILAPGEQLTAATARSSFLTMVGGKACGLAVLPRAWTPPFVVISAALHRRWLTLAVNERGKLLDAVCREVADWCAERWSATWQKGLVLRSSSVKETMSERGAYDSREVPADFNAEGIRSAVEIVYDSFSENNGQDSIAVLVQARVQTLFLGHMSNERRVSKTINQWMWEMEPPAEGEGRFNSQRSIPPDENSRITRANAGPKAFIEALKKIGRWCSDLGGGRVHLELGVSGGEIWVFQIDFEDDQADEGFNPREFLRVSDRSASGYPMPGSPFQEVDHSMCTGWQKIDKIREFLQDRDSPYPKIFYATGVAIQHALRDGRDIALDIEEIARGRAVCRTDCTSPDIPRLNLPKTESVSSAAAAEFIVNTLFEFEARGASPEQVCFIIHKFIPSCVAAWAIASSERQIVLVDALWGLPDGLQYLNHDTFEYDIRRNEVSSERIQYKSLFLQETESGDWKLIRVARSMTRHKTLSATNLRDVAQQTYLIAKRLGKSVQIMWFCDVADEAQVGRNVPWFMMDADDAMPARRGQSISPGRHRFSITNKRDLADVEKLPAGKYVLQLEPEAELFRDSGFLEMVAKISKEKSFPVYLTGSVLSHAFYTLERAGVSVLTPPRGRARTRQRQVFRKLVRDSIPERIKEHGERVSLAHIAKSESRAALVIKLFEESQELLAAQTPSDVIGELADLLEVLRSLGIATGIDWGDVERVAEDKRRTRGSFANNVVLLETSWPAWSRDGVGGGNDRISLKDLGQVFVEGERRIMNFAAAIAKGASNVVTLPSGVDVAVSVVPKGIELREISKDGQKQQSQIAFDF